MTADTGVPPQEFPHVAPEFRALVLKPNPERTRHILSETWIEYERARDVIKMIEMCRLTFGKGRPESLLVYGDSGIGKTMIRTKYCRDHRQTYDKRTGVSNIPVLSIQMPPEPSDVDFFREMLRALGSPLQNRERGTTMREIAVHLLARLSCRIVLIDEIQNVFAGTSRQQRIFLNNLRWLSNEVMMPFVAFGTSDAAGVFDSDAQLRRRFVRAPLVRWDDDLKGFKRFVLTLQRKLPLKKQSCLDTNEALLMLLRASAGITGNVVKIVERAAVEAIEQGLEEITPALLLATCERYGEDMG